MRFWALVLAVLALSACDSNGAMNVSNTSAEIDDPLETNVDSPGGMNVAYDENSAASVDDINLSSAADGNASATNPVPPGQVAGGEGAFCDVVGDRVSSADCAYFRELSQRLESGSAALNAPSTMTRGEAVTVSFALARPASADRPAAETNAANVLGAAPTMTGVVPVGRRMAVRLTGDGFSVTPPDLVEQDLGISGTARWEWRVTPEVEGPHRLVLSAYVVANSPSGGRQQSLIRTMAQDIQVAVSPNDRATGIFGRIMEWLSNIKNLLIALAGVIGAAFGVLVAVRKFRKPANGGGAEGGEPPPEQQDAD